MAINRATIRLSITRSQLAAAEARTYLAQRDPLILIAIPIAILILVAVLGVQLFRVVRAVPDVQPTAPLPIIIVATARAAIPPTAAPAAQIAYQAPPRYVVAFAAPDGVALGAIPEPSAGAITGRYGDGWLSTDWQGATVWLRTADLGASLANAAPPPPAPAPQIVYQVVNQPSAEQAPMMDEAAPTPAQADQIASERQTNIQQHYVQPIVYPTLAPGAQTDVTRAWAVEQWRAEHCIADTCIP